MVGVTLTTANATPPPPPPDAHQKMMGSPRQTLLERTGLPDDEIKSAVDKLNDLRVTNLGSLMVMMTGAGAQDLRHNITPFGQKLMDYVRQQD